MKHITIAVGERVGTVSGLLMAPDDARMLYVMAHGAGAGMRHDFMERAARALADRGVATLRYQFPYMEAGRRRPDAPAIAHATVRAAVAAGCSERPDLPIIAGGKSYGGRMTSQAMTDRPLEGVRALAFLGFPLHPSRRPSTERAAHLADVRVPMLFLQGTRDDLADLELMRAACQALGERAALHAVEGADHSFKVLKRSGRTDEQVLSELADTLSTWAARFQHPPRP